MGDVGGTDAPLDLALLPFISVIAPNESELTFISGVETTIDGILKKDLIREAAAALKRKFADAGNASVEILVTLGKHGSVHFGSRWQNKGQDDTNGLLEHENVMGTYSPTPGCTLNTTGAGDCFRGSFVAARYGEGRSVVEAMQWASAASSLSVEVAGATPSVPKRTATEARVTKALKHSD